MENIMDLFCVVYTKYATNRFSLIYTLEYPNSLSPQQYPVHQGLSTHSLE